METYHPINNLRLRCGDDGAVSVEVVVPDLDGGVHVVAEWSVSYLPEAAQAALSAAFDRPVSVPGDPPSKRPEVPGRP